MTRSKTVSVLVSVCIFLICVLFPPFVLAEEVIDNDYNETWYMIRDEKEKIFTTLRNCFSLEKFEEAMQFRDCFTADEYDTIREIFHLNESHFQECENSGYREYFSKRVIAEEAN